MTTTIVNLTELKKLICNLHDTENDEITVLVDSGVRVTARSIDPPATVGGFVQEVKV